MWLKSIMIFFQYQYLSQYGQWQQNSNVKWPISRCVPWRRNFPIHCSIHRSPFCFLTLHFLSPLPTPYTAAEACNQHSISSALLIKLGDFNSSTLSCCYLNWTKHFSILFLWEKKCGADKEKRRGEEKLSVQLLVKSVGQGELTPCKHLFTAGWINVWIM